jgi:uncharacterized protein (DUF1800 family)
MSAAGLRLSRRQALGMAAGGAAGAAGLRLALLHASNPASSSASAAAGPAGAWASPLGTARGDAAHLLRRAGFAYTAADLDAAAAMSYSDLVDSVLAQPADDPAAPANPVNYQSVTAWWYRQMATTSAQFAEKMTLFWHGLLTSDYRKAGRFPYVYEQNRMFRRMGTGDLRSLLIAVTHDPAMMRYLDLDQSSGRAPNENYSRELMELYTLGVGNYTEDDVREGARALSGIRIAAYDSGGARIQLPRRTASTTVQQYQQQLDQLLAQGTTFAGELTPRLHDSGAKTYLGRTGNLGPDDVIDAILAKDACARFIARRALLFFASPAPTDGYVDRVATAFRSSRYDIRTMMRAVFSDDEFRAGGQYRSLVRAPAEAMVATMRVLNRPDVAPTCQAAGAPMNQVLYDPPTVAGWPVNAGWLSSGAWLGRVNFAHAVVNAGGSVPDPVDAVRTHLDGVVGADTAAVFNASRTDTDRWYAILASPEFHLK